MKKTTKGTIAIAAAITLLLGGAGSLAYWQESATIGASQVTTGQLKVTVGSTATWQVTKYGSTTPTTIDSSYKMVPGDTVTYSVGFTTVAEGTTLKANALVSGGAVTGLPANVSATTAVTYDGAAVSTSPFNVPVGTKTGTVKVTIAWPWGNSTSDLAATMNQTINLASTVVTVTQVANP